MREKHGTHIPEVAGVGPTGREVPIMQARYVSVCHARPRIMLMVAILFGRAGVAKQVIGY